MSVKSRKQIIEKTHEEYQTLADIEDRIQELAASNLNVGGYSAYQRNAAKECSDFLGIQEACKARDIDPIEEILYLCGVTRPPALKDESRIAWYQGWLQQQYNENLAIDWANKIKRMGNRKLEALSSYLREDHASGEIFVTKFNVGSTHKHDGNHGDLLDH